MLIVLTLEHMQRLLIKFRQVTISSVQYLARGCVVIYCFITNAQADRVYPDQRGLGESPPRSRSNEATSGKSRCLNTTLRTLYLQDWWWSKSLKTVLKTVYEQTGISQGPGKTCHKAVSLDCVETLSLQGVLKASVFLPALRFLQTPRL